MRFPLITAGPVALRRARGTYFDDSIRSRTPTFRDRTLPLTDASGHHDRSVRPEPPNEGPSTAAAPWLRLAASFQSLRAGADKNFGLSGDLAAEQPGIGGDAQGRHDTHFWRSSPSPLLSRNTAVVSS